MPRLQALYNEYGSRGFVPLAINLWENMDLIKVYARQYAYPFLRDPGVAWALYRMNGYIPLNYVVDTAGIVVGSMEGFDEYTIRAWIEPYLMGVAEERYQLPVCFDATPNPVTSRFQRVRFRVPVTGSVSLRVYSSLGRLVRNLPVVTTATGQGLAEWDLRDEHGRQVASGAYFYELSAGDEVARMGTMVLR